jgi:hypothetical protein
MSNLKWVTENDVVCKIVVKDGVLVFIASLGNISSEWAIDDTALSIGAAAIQTLRSLETGVEFHAAYGDTPSVGATNPSGKIRTANCGNIHGPTQ